MRQKNDRGWVNNFSHWHNVVKNHHEVEYEKYLDLLVTKNNDDIYFCSYGEALANSAYYSIIKGIDRLNALGSDGKKHIIIKLSLWNHLVNPLLLQVPISIRIPLKELCVDKFHCNYDFSIMKDEYIIEVPYSESPIIDITID